MQNLINQDNWNYCHYTENNLRAIISFGADENAQSLYWLTLIDENDQEVFQLEYADLPKALLAINERYSNEWKFVDLTQPQNGKTGSCSTCVAH